MINFLLLDWELSPHHVVKEDKFMMPPKENFTQVESLLAYLENSRSLYHQLAIRFGAANPLITQWAEARERLALELGQTLKLPDAHRSMKLSPEVHQFLSELHGLLDTQDTQKIITYLQVENGFLQKCYRAFLESNSLSPVEGSLLKKQLQKLEADLFHHQPDALTAEFSGGVDEASDESFPASDAPAFVQAKHSPEE